MKELALILLMVNLSFANMGSWDTNDFTATEEKLKQVEEAAKGGKLIEAKQPVKSQKTAKDNSGMGSWDTNDFAATEEKLKQVKEAAKRGELIEAKQPVKSQKTAKDNSGLVSLWINVSEPDARIRILNIKPKFTQGMKLQSGTYHVEVSKNGFKTFSKWIKVESEKTLSVDLEVWKGEKKKSLLDKIVDFAITVAKWVGSILAVFLDLFRNPSR